MTIETYLLYLVALAVFFATPPDTSQLLIIANSARHGLKRSAWTIAGDLTANALQMSAAAFGIAAVIAASAEAFQVVKWLGVAYLVAPARRALCATMDFLVCECSSPRVFATVLLFRLWVCAFLCGSRSHAQLLLRTDSPRFAAGSTPSLRGSG